MIHRPNPRSCRFSMFLSIILIVSYFKCLLINLNEFGIKKRDSECPIPGQGTKIPHAVQCDQKIYINKYTKFKKETRRLPLHHVRTQQETGRLLP